SQMEGRLSKSPSRIVSRPERPGKQSGCGQRRNGSSRDSRLLSIVLGITISNCRKLSKWKTCHERIIFAYADALTAPEKSHRDTPRLLSWCRYCRRGVPGRSCSAASQIAQRQTQPCD